MFPEHIKMESDNSTYSPFARFYEIVAVSTPIEDVSSTVQEESSSETAEHCELEPGNSSVFGGSVNFINSIVGAGIIGIPYAIRCCGFFTGICLLVFTAWLIHKSVTLLIECGIARRIYDLEALSRDCFGPPGFYAAVGSMMLFAVGGMLAYLVILGDTVTEVISPGGGWTARRLVILTLATGIILPVCLQRDLSSLAHTSLISITADVILVVVVCIFAPKEAREQEITHPGAGTIFAPQPHLFAGVGAIAFAFVCQHNSFLVFRSLRRPTLSTWRTVSAYSVSFSCVLCLFLGERH